MSSIPDITVTLLKDYIVKNVFEIILNIEIRKTNKQYNVFFEDFNSHTFISIFRSVWLKFQVYEIFLVYDFLFSSIRKISRFFKRKFCVNNSDKRSYTNLHC